MYSYGPPHMAVQKQDDQHKHTFSNYVRIRDVVKKTCQRWWTIGKSGERGSEISVLPAWHDDDDDNMHMCMFKYIYIYMYIYMHLGNFVLVFVAWVGGILTLLKNQACVHQIYSSRYYATVLKIMECNDTL